MNQPQQQTPPEAWTERTRLLFGDERVSELAQCHVLIVGLGGVGGFAAELIARAGIGRMTIVDADIVQPSNINRQLVATTETIGEAKASVLAARLRAINPHIQLEVIEAFLKDENMIELLDRHRYDYVIDAIDSLSPKVHLIAKSMERGLPIISSMGAGAKSDPTQIHQADLNKSYNCTLARACASACVSSASTRDSPWSSPRSYRTPTPSRRSRASSVSALPLALSPICPRSSAVIWRPTSSSISSITPPLSLPAYDHRGYPYT